MSHTGGSAAEYTEAGRESAYLGLTDALGVAPGDHGILERGPRATFWESLENDHGHQGAAAAIAGCADAAQAQAEHGSLGPDAASRPGWANDRGPGAKGNEHTLDWALDHPGACQPFGGGPPPDYVTELGPGVYLLEMPGPQAQAEAV